MTTNRRRTSKATDKAKASSSLLFLGLCLCILALRVTYTESPTAQTAGAMSSPTDTIYSLTLSGLLIFAPLAWVLRQMTRGRLRYRLTGIEIGLAVFLVAGVISGVVASDKRVAMTQMAILLGPILSAILLVQVLDSLARVRLVLIVVGALAIVSAYQCAEQFFDSNQMTIEQYEKAPETLLKPLGIEPGSFQQFLFEHRIYSRGVRGFFTTSNSAGSFALMASLAAIALLLEQIRAGKTDAAGSKGLLFRAIATAIVLAGLLLTKSKGGILGFGVAAVLLFAFQRGSRWLTHHRRFALRVLLPVALLLVVLVAGFVVAYGIEHGRLPGGNSMLVRWQYWAASARMVRDHPFLGVGPGNFAQYYPRYKPAAAPESVADPHDFPLSLLTQFGPLGLLGFLLMVFGAIFHIIRRPEQDDTWPANDTNGSSKRTALLLLTAVGATLLLIRPTLLPMPAGGEALVSVYHIVVLYVAPTAAFLIGFLLMAYPIGSAKPKPERSTSQLFAAALGCAVVGVLIHNLVDFALFEPGVWTTFWFVIAGLVATRNHRTQPSVDRVVAAKPMFGGIALAVALLAAYWLFVWNPVYQVTLGTLEARQAVQAGQFDRAHRLLEAAHVADSLDPGPLSLDGQVFTQQYEMASPSQPALLREAADRFRQAISIDPAGYRNYERLGAALTDLGQYGEALQAYSNAIERYSGLGRLWLARGKVNEQLGRTNAALADYRRAVDIENAFREQFQRMYPQHEQIVSRIGESNYRFAQERIAALTR